MKKGISRRSFIMNSLSSISALGVSGLSIPQALHAQAAGPGKLCIVIQLMGGLDPLLALPYTEEYAALETLRGSYARVNSSANPATYVPIHQKLALHPKLAPLASHLVRTKIFLHTGNALHLPPDRSHDVASVRMALGGSPEEFGRLGWMARLYDQGSASLIGLGGVAESFNCEKCSVRPLVSSSYDALDIANATLSHAGGAANVALIDDTLRKLSNTPGQSPLEEEYKKSQRSMYSAIEKVRSILSFTTPLDQSYLTPPAWSEFSYNTGQTYIDNQGRTRNADAEWLVNTHMNFMKKFRNMAQTAMEMKARNNGERLILVASQGGYDIHDNWMKSGHNLMASLGMALRTLLDDLSAIGMLDHTVVLITSEFGRTITGNGSGTDHGIGYPSFVIGGKVDGVSGGQIKIVQGTPLSVSELQSYAARGNAWPREVAQESIIAEIIEKHLGLDPALAFGEEFLSKLANRNLGIFRS